MATSEVLLGALPLSIGLRQHVGFHVDALFGHGMFAGGELSFGISFFHSVSISFSYANDMSDIP